MSKVVAYLVGQVREFSGLRVAIPDAGLVIGRDPKQVDVVFDHAMVSRRHAQIALGQDGKLHLIDLQSRNGTHVNGQRITAPVPLAAGDKLDFGGDGKAVFVFESAETTSVSGVLKEAFGETVAPVEWKVGDTILDLYEVTGLLGQGGFGKVYRVHHKSWNMDLAVKSPLPQLFADEKAVENFIREAETWVNLDLHPNIVQCHYVRTIGGIPRIFAEYIPGGTLHHWIAHRKLTTLDQILDVAVQFAWGLHAAHEKGLVHQDVKPLNVLMTPDGTAKVSDFGLARAKPVIETNITTADGDLVTMAGKFTVAYCSPEQSKGERLSRKTDIWSWGLSVLQMFTGAVTWQHGCQALLALASYQTVGGPCFLTKPPDGVQRLLERCFQDRPEKRPQDMLKVAAELQEIYSKACGKVYERPEPKAAEHLADGLNNRALSLLDLGKQDEADTLWQQALRVQPHHVESTYNQGLIRWRRSQIADDALSAILTDTFASHSRDWLPVYLCSLVDIERDLCSFAVERLRQLEDADKHRLEVKEALLIAEQRLPQSVSRLRTLEGHLGAEVRSVRLSSDGRQAVSVAADGLAKCWDLRSGKCLTTCRLDDSCEKVHIGAGLRLVLFTNGEGAVKLSSIESGSNLGSPEATESTVTAICLSHDNRVALIGFRDGRVGVWEVFAGRWSLMRDAHSEEVLSLCLSADDRYAMSASFSSKKPDVEKVLGTFRFWNAATGVGLRKWENTNNYIEGALCLNGDGSTAFSGGSATVWKTQSEGQFRSLEGQRGYAELVALSNTGELALALDSVGLRLWNTRTGQCIRTIRIAGAWPPAMDVSFGTGLALVATRDGEMELWNLGDMSNRVLAPFRLNQPISSAKAVAVQKGYERALEQARKAMQRQDAVGCANWIREARAQPGCRYRIEATDLWTTLQQRLPRVKFVGGRLGLSLARRNSGWSDATWLSPDGRYAILPARWQSKGTQLVHNDFGVELWDLTTGRRVQEFRSGITNSLSVGESRNLMLAGSKAGMVTLWELPTGRFLRSFEGHDDDVQWVWLSKQEDIAASGDSQGNVIFWNVPTGRCLLKRKRSASDLTSVLVSRDERHVLAGAKDGTMELWELLTGASVRLWKAHHKAVASVSADWNRKLAVSAERCGSVKAWELSTGRCLSVMETQSPRAYAAALSIEGRYVFSGSEDGSVQVWDTTKGEVLGSFAGHGDFVHSMVVSDDCTRVVTSTAYGESSVWMLDWELENREPADWDEGARPYIETFLTLHTPYAGELPADRQPTEDEIGIALTRRGKPVWSDKDFERLLYTLGCAGYGWLRSEGVRRELEKMAANRSLDTADENGH